MDHHAPMEAWDRALAFAAEHHAGAFRKGSRRPYLTHVVAVSDTLAYHYPERDALIVAGLLHDVVEDTGASFELLRAEFGDEVERLVRAVSKDRAAMERRLGLTVAEFTAGLEREEAQRALWHRQREYLLQNLRANGVEPDVLRLMAADALANLGDIARDLLHPEVGTAVWKLFKVGRDETLGYYHEVAEAVRAGLGDEHLVTELQGRLSELERQSAEAVALGSISDDRAALGVRLATAADVDAVALLFDAFRQHHGASSDEALARQFVREQIASRAATVLVAESPTGTVIGFALLVAGFSPVQTLPIYGLADLYVDPGARRRGVGRALLRAAEYFARAAGAVRIQLRVRTDNAPARALYASLGWQQVDGIDEYVLLM